MRSLGLVFVSLFICVACSTKTPVEDKSAPTAATKLSRSKAKKSSSAASAANSSSAKSGPCTGDQSLPMLGYKENHIEDACDKKFIETVLEQSDNNRKVANQAMIEYGWKALEKNPNMAVKRFNQAWLLDRKNYESYWGFGVWEMKRGNTAKAKSFLSKAMSMAPKPAPPELQETWDQIRRTE